MNVIKKIFDNKVYAVLRTVNYNETIEKTEALIKGGIEVIEINLNNEEICKAIEFLTEKYPDVCISAGGIITEKQAQIAVKSGAKMISSPIFQINLAKFSQSYNIPVMTSAATINEAYLAWKARIPIIKLYPAQHIGGAELVEDILRPMPFLNLMPAGSINIDNFLSYLNAGAKAVAMGRSLYKDATPAEITEKALKITNLIKEKYNK